jgi:hypothetical protein
MISLITYWFLIILWSFTNYGILIESRIKIKGLNNKYKIIKFLLKIKISYYIFIG